MFTGFRIIVNSVEDCYRSSSLIHNFYKPIEGRFKDYIAIPKSNGYQALHTTLLAIDSIPIEVQIQTKSMELIAENESVHTLIIRLKILIKTFM